MPNEGSTSPKERVNIVYRPATGDVQEDVELPLKLMVLGDFTLRKDDTMLEDRKPISVDKDNFDKVMQSQGLSLQLQVPNKLSDDPDAPDPAAPKRIWLHWLVVNIPTETAGFAEGIRDYPQGCLVAVNDSGVRGWSGPRPPIGRHRYFFKLYALDTVLDLPENFTRAQAEAAMQGHVIESAVTMGTYLLSSNR